MSFAIIFAHLSYEISLIFVTQFFLRLRERRSIQLGNIYIYIKERIPRWDRYQTSSVLYIFTYS